MRKGLGSYLRDNRQPSRAAAALSRVRVTTCTRTRHATQLAQAASATRNIKFKMLTQAPGAGRSPRASVARPHADTQLFDANSILILQRSYSEAQAAHPWRRLRSHSQSLTQMPTPSAASGQATRRVRRPAVVGSLLTTRVSGLHNVLSWLVAPIVGLVLDEIRARELVFEPHRTAFAVDVHGRF